jgi:hypothetical protein
MNVILLQGDIGGTYELLPSSKRNARKQKEASGEETVLFQTDWDYPGLARELGWNGKGGRERCRHFGTDGTVACNECGKTASEFISAAAEWLDRHCGQTFRGKGEDYFTF